MAPRPAHCSNSHMELSEKRPMFQFVSHLVDAMSLIPNLIETLSRARADLRIGLPVVIGGWLAAAVEIALDRAPPCVRLARRSAVTRGGPRR